VPTAPSRVLVYGVTGSGKSTLAAAVAARLGLPLHLIDDLMWRPGWVPVAAADQRALVEAIVAEPRWVLDAAYGDWRDLPLAAADLIVGLDYPRWLSLARLVRRTAVRIVRRTTVCGDNVETLRRSVFAHDSIVRFHFQSFGRKRRRMREWHAAEPARVVLLRSPRETARWLRDLG
jgi:adenylate kinase family enzyme